MPETDNHNISNHEYALAFNNGDENALSFFYHSFYPALVFYSHQLTKNRPLAEEIASEAFVKTWRMHYKLNSYPGIKSYLYKIVHRDSIEAISGEQKRVKAFHHLQSLSIDTPFDNLVRTEVSRIIHEALENLTPAARRVVIMYFLEGKSTGQIARELNQHPSTIKTHKMLGLKALKKIVTKPFLWLFYFCINISVVFH